MDVRITLDGDLSVSCPDCESTGLRPTQWEEMSVAIDDSGRTFHLGYEPTARECCDCPAGRARKVAGAIVQAAEDATIETEYQAHLAQMPIDCGF